MANLVQRLTLAFVALSVAAYGEPFSHKLHLLMKLACASCHADEHLPTKQACAGCHKADEIAIKAPRELFVTHFSHKQHLQLGNLAPVIAAAIDKGAYLSKPGEVRRFLNGTNPCAACHRGMEESDAVSMASFPQMADCLVCHNQIDPPDSCAKCHAPGPRLRPASHTPDFQDKHNNGKLGLDLTSCAVCHGRKFQCMGCHRL